MKSIFGFVVVAMIAVGCATTTQQQNRDARLVGEWRCVSAVVNGKALPAETVKLLRVRLTADGFRTEKGAEVLFDSKYRVDTTAKPRRIFMMGNEGDLTGKEAQGIYSIKGNQLTICYALPGDPAPTQFVSAVGSKAFLLLCERVKE
jgi:uncharacterized protein (TIGR03067 family)